MVVIIIGYQAGAPFPSETEHAPKKSMTRLEDLQPTTAVRGNCVQT
jgi:hypothetical protein